MVLVMNVSLTKKLEEWVQGKVETGMYSSASEVVRDALRLLHTYEAEKNSKFENLRGDVLTGLIQLREGRGEVLDDKLIDSIKKAGRNRLDGK